MLLKMHRGVHRRDSLSSSGGGIPGVYLPSKLSRGRSVIHETYSVIKSLKTVIRAVLKFPHECPTISTERARRESQLSSFPLETENG